ncbi:tyrosine-type recombinase/integrase [Ktedonospora formicarum]|uniref:Integrase n=1 Tax=Ktedonospora formicarum TaxID=2778364 RepID=A0A8J3I324_9CHLR|nr:tyrosine-type recombinase/integrase [Ktedonospora formicarum]GHO44569.1 hypothetical protein KSX_27320 [Ktedonospora formicarum]
MTSVKSGIEDFLAEKDTLETKTLNWYTQKLAVFSAWCENESIELEDINKRTVVAFQNHLKASRSPRKDTNLSSYTIAGYIQVIKTFLTWCTGDDEYEDIVNERAIRNVKKPKVDITIIEAYTDEHIKLLRQAASKEYSQSLRDRTTMILNLLLGTGIRAHELVTLTIGNVFTNTNDPHIKVYGKGRKWREVPLHNDLRRQIKQFINTHRKDAGRDDLLIVGRYGEPMTTSGLDRVFKRLNEHAQIKDVRVSAHTCRHTFAKRFLLRNNNIYALSVLLGHSSVKVTEIYLRSITANEVRKNL